MVSTIKNNIGNEDYQTEYANVVIVGAGVAGTSTLHHLLPYQKDIVILDAGTAPGHGFDQNIATNTVTAPNEQPPQQNNEFLDMQPRYSGTAVFIMDNHDKANPNAKMVTGNDDSPPYTDVTASTDTSLQVSQQEQKIIKMMVQIFACSIDTFISHHGVQGAQIYLQCTRLGLQFQKRIAKELLSNARNSTSPSLTDTNGTILHELGSFYLAYEDDVDDLKKEYNQFVSLGTNLFDNLGIEWYQVSIDGDSTILHNSDHTNSILLSQKNPFHAAIYFPNDAIIDSSQYSKLLVQNATSVHNNDTERIQSRVRSRMNTIVTYIERLEEVRPYPCHDTSTAGLDMIVDDSKMYSAIVTCYDTTAQRFYRIYCRHVVVAIGGLSVPPGCCVEDLYGILRPCYSYLAHVPMKQPMQCHFMKNDVKAMKGKNDDDSSRLQRSPNFFTWNFTHDWCYTDQYHIRVSGEDHYSARKDALQSKRCQSLINWTYEQYNTETGDNSDQNISFDNDLEHDSSPTIPQQSGVYTETPDCAPVVGSIASDTNNTICYVVGCNAWGQAILSYAATLVPSILGYRPMTLMEQDAMKVLSIQRFQHSIAVPIRRPCHKQSNSSEK